MEDVFEGCGDMCILIKYMDGVAMFVNRLRIWRVW